jgi:hypothetical protein
VYGKDSRLPTSCKFCSNPEQTYTRICFLCHSMVCFNHYRLVRKLIGQKRRVNCCTECLRTHPDLYEEIVP